MGCWVYIPDGVASGTGTLVFTGRTTVGNQYGMLGFVDSGSDVVPVLRTRNGSTEEIDTGGDPLPVDQWVRIWGVWESTTSRKIYVNGALVETFTASSPTPTSASSRVASIGMMRDSSPNLAVPAGTRICDVQIWSAAPNLSDIQHDYNDSDSFLSNNGNIAFSACEWAIALDEGSGSSADNLSSDGAARDGSITAVDSAAFWANTQTVFVGRQ